MSAPEISIVIVTHNDRRHLPACLDSIPEGPEVIVVDNASSDGTSAWLRNERPSVRHIASDENIGFSRANNLGIRSSRGRLVLILNPDTVLSDGALAVLASALDEDPSVAVAAPVLFDKAGKYQVSFGGSRSFFAEMGQKLFLNAAVRRRIGFFSSPRDVSWVSGACFLARRSALEEIGGFDERYFLYFEDIDLCRRIRSRGRVVLVPEARIFHAGGASTGAKPLFSRFHYRRSQLLFYRSHNSRLSLFWLRLYLRLAFSAQSLRGWLARSDERRELRKFFGLLSEKPEPDSSRKAES